MWAVHPNQLALLAAAVATVVADMLVLEALPDAVAPILYHTISAPSSVSHVAQGTHL